MKVLYLMHNDWGWIKQRTHLLVEQLDAHFEWDVYVIYKFQLKNRSTLGNKDRMRKGIGLPFLPFRYASIKVLEVLDKFIWRTLFKLYRLFGGYSMVVVTHPLLFKYVEGIFDKVVYDLHDDNAEFYENGYLSDLILEQNEKLLAHADLVIFSSAYLRDKFLNKVRTETTGLVRNAHGLSIENIQSNYFINEVRTENNKSYKIFYFGTISEWFDYSALLTLLEHLVNVEIHLIGPLDSKRIEHPRLIYYGPMAHADMLRFVRTADAFIMPFLVTELILGVDPVKLYEYLAYPVPVFAKRYPEIEYFNGLINFYDTNSELLNLVRNAIVSKKVATAYFDERIAFLKANSWAARGAAMSNLMKAVVA